MEKKSEGRNKMEFMKENKVEIIESETEKAFGQHMIS